MKNDEYISVSRIKLYRLCPRKYKFAYIDNLPKPFKPVGLAFGSAVHSAVEWLNRRLFEGEKISFEEVWKTFKTDWFSLKQDNILFDEKEDEEDIIAKAEKLLKLLHERQTNGVKIAEVETPFQIPLFDRETGEVLPLPLRGVFDWVEDNDTLVEMKTSKRAYDTSSSSNRLQLAAYEFASKEMFDESPNIRIVNLVKTKEPKLLETEVKLDDNDHKVLIGAAKLFILGVKDGIFHPIKSFMCKGCEYADICGNGV